MWGEGVLIKFEPCTTARCLQVENSLSTYEPHGCVVVYSVVQRSSFRQAEETINYLWRENVTRDKTVILVGNKADLARSRVIPTTGNSELKALTELVVIAFLTAQHERNRFLINCKQTHKQERKNLSVVVGRVERFAWAPLSGDLSASRRNFGDATCHSDLWTGILITKIIMPSRAQRANRSPSRATPSSSRRRRASSTMSTNCWSAS